MKDYEVFEDCEKIMMFRVWYKGNAENHEPECCQALFETEEAAKMFCEAIGDRLIARNKWKWETRIER